MSDTTPNSKGPAQVQHTPEATGPALIPVDQVNPEDIGTLSIEYRDGHPVTDVSGGTYVPAVLTVAHEAANAVGAYSVAPQQARSLDTTSSSLEDLVDVNVEFSVYDLAATLDWQSRAM
ncbi:hypothetical protein [Streptomyces jumonjinensis]|uniref:Uncharacterized protein n=1 Tax=Streptomyces jumonjinensis TaxID=1945 RepID=A0A646KCH9_STRJU|nr:hypothetical protein [Streptomyces jumonjinensis]MQS99971.1 hypothetical protein [Streptomyces jumonjinensis]